MASSEIQLTQILWDIIEGNMSLSEAWDKANYDSFRISELDIGNNLRTSTWCLAQLIPIKAFTVILKSNVEMWCCYFLFFSCLFLMCLCPLWILKKKFIVLEGWFFFLLEQQIFSKIYMIIKRKLYSAFMCLLKHPSDITDCSHFSPILAAWWLGASNILVCWSTLCLLYLTCVFILAYGHILMLSFFTLWWRILVLLLKEVVHMYCE